MIAMKYIADVETSSRMVITLLLIWIGRTRGAEGLFLAAFCLIASWTSDILDGSLARLSKTHTSTWIGNHDLYFDMAAAIGLLTISLILRTALSICLAGSSFSGDLVFFQPLENCFKPRFMCGLL